MRAAINQTIWNEDSYYAAPDNASELLAKNGAFAGVGIQKTRALLVDDILGATDFSTGLRLSAVDPGAAG
jgi:hypothetical protein